MATGFASSVTAQNAKGSDHSELGDRPRSIAPTAPITNHRPTLTILSARFLGATMYARFRICDDSLKNVTIIETDSRPGKLSYTRRFSTLIAPRPCGVYTRHWTPVARFRGTGRYTVTLKTRDKSGFTSLPARRSFSADNRSNKEAGRRTPRPRLSQLGSGLGLQADALPTFKIFPSGSLNHTARIPESAKLCTSPSRDVSGRSS